MPTKRHGRGDIRGQRDIPKGNVPSVPLCLVPSVPICPGLSPLSLCLSGHEQHTQKEYSK